MQWSLYDTEQRWLFNTFSLILDAPFIFPTTVLRQLYSDFGDVAMRRTCLPALTCRLCYSSNFNFELFFEFHWISKKRKNYENIVSWEVNSNILFQWKRQQIYPSYALIEMELLALLFDYLAQFFLLFCFFNVFHILASNYTSMAFTLTFYCTFVLDSSMDKFFLISSSMDKFVFFSPWGGSTQKSGWFAEGIIDWKC